jgi:hypothetical protein
MTNEEYSLLFHRAQVNLVAFKRVNDCDSELRGMVEMAVAAERDALEAELLKLKKGIGGSSMYIQGRWDLIGEFQDIIRARGNRT